MRAAWLLVLLMLGRAAVYGQSSTANGVLLDMAGQAGVVFAGTVESVTRQDDAGYVDILFHVEQSVRGARAGTVYVLREWAGLWSGPARYAAGQRRLMLLAARGPSGISAPVGGTDGAVPVFTDADGTVRVDLRWVRARALRGVASEAGGAASGPSGQAHEDPFNPDWPGPVAPLAGGGPGAATPEPELQTVLALLGGAGGG